MGKTRENGWTALAGADLSSSQKMPVKIGAADHTVILCADDADVWVGVIEEDQEAASGEQVGLQTGGIARMVVGTAGAVSRGDNLTWDGTNDDGVKTAAAGDFVGGVALEAGSTGEVIDVLLTFAGIL